MKKVTVIPPISVEEEEALRKGHNRLWKSVPNGRSPMVEVEDIRGAAGQRLRRRTSGKTYRGYNGS